MSRSDLAEMMRGIQAAICDGLSEDFTSDRWQREGGGGGLTRIVTDGDVLEKGGVNVSEVFGHFREEFAEQIPGSGTAFYATGVSVVLHPHSPHVPTVHANFRYIEHGDKSWFGGGADLTPYFFHLEDKEHFHSVWRRVCDNHPGVADYEAFRRACDRYFYLPHREERRGVGGIVFESMDVDEASAAFVREAGHAFLDSYAPIIERRATTPVTPAQRRWQECRRGRYVEFNLLYDRGTLFGLETGGRVESILMSLPPRVRWDYATEPAPGTPERALLDQLSARG